MSYHNGYQPKRQPMPESVTPPPEPPRTRCVKEFRQSRLSGHDVYDATLKCPGVMGMSMGDCHDIAQILNRKLGLL